ncbi:hypothetical protein [Halomicrobium katesii]|uniref:hypothetical protein n=1 Tax=Halomicrobium katesii TaxID=437163 RepID=UPI00037E0375|nr:hypothetical protein [Halomicrobium katesii]
MADETNQIGRLWFGFATIWLGVGITVGGLLGPSHELVIRFSRTVVAGALMTISGAIYTGGFLTGTIPTVGTDEDRIVPREWLWSVAAVCMAIAACIRTVGLVEPLL